MLADLPIHYLRHPINLGQGAALQTGMDYAKAQGAEAVIHFDADGQHDKNDIPQFLAALETGVDVVIGSRFLRESDLAQVPKGKRLVLRCARIVNGVFTGMWLTDAHNGFRALGRKALEAIDLTENRMAHATEIMSQIRAAKLTVKEVPVTIRYTDYSQAKGQKWTNSLNILIDLILNKIM
jgi:glycosyltransferase involved in cell wall biosynthesis